MNRMELHSHTHYSNIRLLDSINKPKDLINRALEIGLTGICITDHECLSSSIEVNIYAQELLKDNPNFKIGLGNEIYLIDDRENCDEFYHFILIAKDKEGHRQLRELSSLAWMNSYFFKGMERVPTLKRDLENIVSKNPGHLIATTACLGGELSSNTLKMENARKIGDNRTAEECKQNIIDFVLWCKKLFANDIYMEIAPAANRDQIIVNKKIAELSKVFDVKMVIGCDAHYLTKEDRYVHKSYLNSKDGEREIDAFYEYSYLQTEEEIIKNLTPSIADLYEQMCRNSMEIWDKIENYSLLHPQQIPKIDVKDYPKLASNMVEAIREDYPILASMFESNDKVERYWVNECTYQLKRINKDTKEYWQRLEEEADIKRTIGEALNTNMFAYPVTLQHYVDLFWKCGSMVGAGRGSSCSGLNHYLLGVTQLDPLEWDLPFWRYLNKERFELGDIDLDLCPSKRPLILQKIKEERGANFNEDIDEITRQNCGCTLIATFGTETTKSAIQTACRGYRSEEYPDGIDVDTAQYLSSLIPQERGFLWDLHDVVYGNDDKDRRPIAAFINEVDEYPGLLDIMMGIEGLISRRGSHASGVILFDEDPYEFGCFMKTPNGDIITQYDLHMCEAAGMTKYDFLVTEVQDKLVQCINLLQKYGKIEKELTLREVYNKYFHPRVLPLDDEEAWQNVQQVNVIDLFQFDSDVGSQAAKKIAPTNILELADANGLMRLMTAEKGAETPMEKYIRYKNHIDLWYQEMDKYGLTKEEQKVLEPHFLRSYGVPPSQEQLMTMLMDENICAFSLKDANAARKIVGKKQMSKIPELHQQILEQAKSPALGKYVWDCGVGPQMGYSFSIIHALAYSFIGFQTAYIATEWNPIFWDTACLVVNSGSLESDDENTKEKGADYAKIAKAIGAIKEKNIEVSLININTSDFGFEPDEENNRILYGLKALSNVGTETIDKIKAGRPYRGIKDFMERCPIPKLAIINLIKAGAFDEIDKDFNGDRRMIMAYYLMQNCDAKKKLTLQNFNGLIQHNLIPKDLELQIRVYNFTKYLKAYRKVGKYYTFDDACLTFYERFMQDYLDDLEVINGITCILQTTWEKIYKKHMDVARDWLKANHDEILEEYNKILFKEAWNKYAEGNTSKWEMDSMCFYHGKHELADVDMNKYGVVDFNSLSTEPEVDYFFKRGGHQIPIYKTNRIMGTVLAKNDNKSSIILLTTTGVVTVKFTRDYYAMFKKQISQVQADGKKKVIEKSWFKRGNKLMITGIRRDDMFIAKTYKSTNSHQLYKIDEVIGTEIKLRHERMSPDGSFAEEEEEYYG